MPERKSRRIKEKKPTITLRRSPRFHPVNQSDRNDRTEIPKRKRLRVADSFSTPLGSAIVKTQRESKVVLQKSEKENICSRSSAKSSRGCRKLEGGAYCSKIEKGRDSQKQCVREKVVTRSSVRGSGNSRYQVNEPLPEEGSSKKINVLLKEGKAKVDIRSCEQCICSIERRVTRSLSRKNVEQGSASSRLSLVNEHKVVIESDEGEPKMDAELSKPRLCRRNEKNCSIKKERVDTNGGRKMQVGEKRNINQVEEESEDFQEWTKDQDLALRRAYFTAKATPHFWKKVARMVPGKSAEECFNRIHADKMTPPQPRKRPAANKSKSSPLLFSASKLLSPAETKIKKLRFSRRKSVIAQKTVREILQKQQHENQELETDLFAVLEQTADQSPINILQGRTFSSPTPDGESGKMSSSSVPKKHFSRLSSLGRTAFLSPPVLKQIKNKALHEKYIDHIHFRDAKRRTQSRKNAKCIQGKNDKNVTDVKLNSVKLAKEALIFEAEDAINQFRILQSRTTNEVEDSGDEEDVGEEGTP